VRAPREQTLALTRSLLALRAVRSARKESDVVMVRVDPSDGW
jgi:primosomal protein N' (replication factor Y)